MGEAGGEGNPVEGWGDGVGCRGGGGRKVGGVEGVGEESVPDTKLLADQIDGRLVRQKSSPE